MRAPLILVSILVASPALAGGDKNEIRSVVIDEATGATRVHVHGAQTPTFTVYKLEKPTRVVIDLPRARLAEALAGHDGTIAYTPSTWAVSTVAAQQLDDGGALVRVIVTLARPGRYDVKSEGNDVVIAVTARDAAPEAPNGDALARARKEADAARADAANARTEAEAARREAARTSSDETAKAKADATKARADELAAKADAAKARAEAQTARAEAEAARTRSDEAAAAKADATRARAEAAAAKADAEAARAETLAAKREIASARSRGDEVAAAKADATRARAEADAAKREIASAKSRGDETAAAKADAARARAEAAAAKADAEAAKHSAELARSQADDAATHARAEATAAKAEAEAAKRDAAKLRADEAAAAKVAELAKSRGDEAAGAKADAAHARAEAAAAKAEADAAKREVAKLRADELAAAKAAELAKSRGDEAAAAKADAARARAEAAAAKAETEAAKRDATLAKSQGDDAAAAKAEAARARAEAERIARTQSDEVAAAKAEAARARAEADAAKRDAAKLRADEAAAAKAAELARSHGDEAATAKAEAARARAEADAARADAEAAKRETAKLRADAVTAARAAELARAKRDEAATAKAEAARARAEADAAKADAEVAKHTAAAKAAELAKARGDEAAAAKADAARARAEAAAAKTDAEAARAEAAADKQRAEAMMRDATDKLAAIDRKAAQAKALDDRATAAVAQAQAREAAAHDAVAKAERERDAAEAAARTARDRHAEAKAADDRADKARKAIADAETRRAAVEAETARARQELAQTQAAVAAVREQRAAAARADVDAKARATRVATREPSPTAPRSDAVASIAAPQFAVAFTGKNGFGDLELGVAAGVRVSEGVATKTHAELILDGVASTVDVERQLDVTRFRSPIRSITIYRDESVIGRVHVVVSFIAPATPSLVPHAGGMRWHFSGRHGMSGAPTDEAVHSAVPIADLSVVDAALRARPDALDEAVKKVRPADLGRDLSRRPLAESTRILDACDDRHGAAMLRAAHPAVAAHVLAAIDCKRAGKLLGFLPTDHEVAILALLEPAPRAKIEASYEPGDKAAIDRLLAYPETAVGRMMTTKIWRCERTATAGEAIALLRAHAETIEVAVNCYITDGAKLVGVIPLRALSIAEPTTPIADIMTPDPIAVREDALRGDAAEIINTHDFLSLPIVNATGDLVGAVRVDDLLGATLEGVGTGILNQGAVSGKLAGRAPYFLTPIIRTVRSRLTWLVLLFVAETATGTVLRYFDDELAKVVALSFFVPLLIGTGGNAGSQTVSTIIRALALGEVRTRDVLRVVRREVSAGLLLGILLGTIAFFRALLWGVDYDLAACVAVTILVVCTWANAVGAAIPLVAQRFGIDPTVISAPLITTLVDASGLFIYFSVAKLMIASLSTSPIPQDTPPWETVSIVSRDLHVDAASDAQGHVHTLAITGPTTHIELAPAWLATLPPLEADTLVLRGEGTGDARKLIVSFATGGADDEHVRLTVAHGKVAQVAIARQTAEGKDKSELRPLP